MCGIIAIVNAILLRVPCKKNCNKATVGWFHINRNVSNDDDIIIIGDGNAERENEEWDGNVSSRNDNVLRLISITALLDD